MSAGYTQDDLQDAKDFLALRIKLENGLLSGIHSLLYAYAVKIIQLGYKYRTAPSDFAFSNSDELQREVDSLIAQLLDEIYALLEDAVSNLTDDEETRDNILTYLASLGNGQDVYAQIGNYLSNYKGEMEAFIAAGLLAGYNYLRTANDYLANMKLPWTDALITKAFAMPFPRADRLRSRGATFGTGRSNVSATQIDRITVGSLDLAWWQLGIWDMKEKGAIGYYQLRGSNYPCELCDMEAGFHPMEDADNGYPHSHCKCYRVPAYELEE
jgi:hypothetical protein